MLRVRSSAAVLGAALFIAAPARAQSAEPTHDVNALRQADAEPGEQPDLAAVPVQLQCRRRGPLGFGLLQFKKDHVFGIGVEGSVFLPKQKLLLGLRYVPEFGAINRTQGYTFMLTLAYQTKSLMKMPAP